MYEKIKTRSPNFDLHPVFEIPQTTSYWDTRRFSMLYINKFKHLKNHVLW